MRKFTLVLSAAALAITGAALVQPATAQPGAGQPDDAQARPARTPPTRADVEKHADDMFTRMDVNKDGKLDAKDREAREAERFAQLDKDGNGQLSLQEFSAARPGGPDGPGMRGPGGPRMGMGMDHGPDGPPPPGEGGKPGGKRMGKGMGQDMGKGMGFAGPGPMMDPMAADANKDGAISREEFKAAALARFDKADSDGDGKISKAERKESKAARRDMRRAPDSRPAN
ncbi:MAG TPA: hypothetical protein VEZ26_02990 [Sphingomonadaceae bacterium]|nr:hypothetical protein [Sphingomonadaceae bacterium]